MAMGISEQVENPPSLAAMEAGGPISLFLDFDGTLVEIAPGPDAILVPSSLRDGLIDLATRLEHRLALVSGARTG